MGFCYQKNTKELSAVRCRREEFWKSIRQSSTPWLIDSRREIMAAVEAKDEEAMARWAAHEDFRKFELISVTALISAVALLTFILKMKTGTYDGEVTNISTFFAKYQTIGYFSGFIIFLVLTFMLYISFLKKPRKLIKG